MVEKLTKLKFSGLPQSNRTPSQWPVVIYFTTGQGFFFPFDPISFPLLHPSILSLSLSLSLSLTSTFLFSHPLLTSLLLQFLIKSTQISFPKFQISSFFTISSTNFNFSPP